MNALTSYAVDLVVSIGAGSIVGNVVNHTTPLEQNVLRKASVSVASIVLGSLLGEVASNHAKAKIVEIQDQLRIIRNGG